MQPNHDMPMHEIDEDGRYTSDFYAYLEQPENDTRYTPTLDWLTRWYGDTRFSLLDVGCGHGQLGRLAPDRCDYVGIDHSMPAIDRCRALYPHRDFLCADVLDFAGTGNDDRRFDAVVLAGMINHMVDKDTLATKSDRRILSAYIESVAKPGGFVSIIVGVPYRSDPEYGLFPQAAWKHGKIADAVEGLPLAPVALSLTVQLGLENKIRQQRQRPDWFIERPEDATSNRHTGEFIASLTALYRVKAQLVRPAA
jgi:SAM-dependent methyltransferase